MKSLTQFDRELRILLRNHKRPRPFVCEGNPLECEVFIVGFNAATEMEAEFWDFWSSDEGFNKQAWFDSYCLERAEKPLAPGKTRRNKVSATRQRIEWIVSKARPRFCLETNLFVTATPEAKDLAKEARDSSVFEFLLRVVQPKVVFLHGVDARKHVAAMSRKSIAENRVQRINLFGANIRVLAMPHLSRGWSKQKAFEVGRELGELCAS